MPAVALVAGDAATGLAGTVLAGTVLVAPATDVLPDEPQAVSSSAAHPSMVPASIARAAPRRAHDKRTICMDSPTHDVPVAAQRAMSPFKT